MKNVKIIDHYDQGQYCCMCCDPLYPEIPEECTCRCHHANDSVNHPRHYTGHPSGIECIEVTRHMNFNIGNAIKYLWRHGKKHKKKTIEDLEKAVFYINDEINKLKNDANRN